MSGLEDKHLAKPIPLMWPHDRWKHYSLCPEIAVN
jgi:hypothetical protein